jgi:hypothetical protein
MEELEQEGHKIPDLLPANFVSCKDLKEAKKLVLIYSSIYARVNEGGLYDYLQAEGLDFDSLNLEIDLPEIDLEKFATFYLGGDVPSGDEQSRLDEKTKVKCPNCGNEFTP